MNTLEKDWICPPGIAQSSSCPVVRDTVERSQMLGESRGSQGGDSLGQICGLLAHAYLCSNTSLKWVGVKYQVLLTSGQTAKN